MYLTRIYEPGQYEYRLRYVIASILRDRIANEGAFKTCFEMEDGQEIIVAILRRGLRDEKLRRALEGSHIVSLVDWLVCYPQFAMKYQVMNEVVSEGN
jgi:hypothetical protein